MVTLILLVLLLYVVHILLPAAIFYAGSPMTPAERLRVALGPRDDTPSPTLHMARARRAQANLEESLPFFWVTALLLLHLGGADGIAVAGGWVFFVARALYLPAYVTGIPVVRSLLWVAGVAGIVMMLARLHQP